MSSVTDGAPVVAQLVWRRTRLLDRSLAHRSKHFGCGFGSVQGALNVKRRDAVRSARTRPSALDVLLPERHNRADRDRRRLLAVAGGRGVTCVMAVTSDAEVYRKYADELIRFCAALVGPSGAEDLLATAVVKALAAPRWAEVENKRAYLYRVVLNEASRVRRDTARRLERELRTA